MPVAAPPTSVAFGLRLLAQLGPGAALSPFSVHRALATVREGASGAAREALDAVLGPEAPAALEVSDPGVELALAQAVWIDRAYRLAPGFAARAQALGVECRTVELATAAPEVNAWAAERTRGMIDSVVDGFEPDEVFALADAAYFDGAWTQAFDPGATAPATFRREDGTASPVPTMHAEGEFEYGEDDDLAAIRLPYGDTLDLGFIAVLAREGLEPPLIGAERWGALRAGMARRSGKLALPRLALESRLDLDAPLRALGLGPAFEPGADWDGLFEGPGRKALSRVLHRARVDLDERGTRAAAVTVVTARAVSLVVDPPPPFDLRLDRPFLWAIEHRPTGTLLFLGTVTDPEESI